MRGNLNSFIHSSIRNGSEFNCKQNYKLKLHFFRSNEIEEEQTTMALIAPMILKKICPILMTSMKNKPMNIASSESGSNGGDAFENELWKDENENFGLRDPSVERRRLWENILYHIGGTTDLYFSEATPQWPQKVNEKVRGLMSKFPGIFQIKRKYRADVKHARRVEKYNKHSSKASKVCEQCFCALQASHKVVCLDCIDS